MNLSKKWLPATLIVLAGVLFMVSSTSCGIFGGGSSAINGTWYAVAIEGQPLPQQVREFDGAMYVTFDVKKKQVGGRGICNNFGAKLIVKGKTLRTDEFMSTRVACQNQMYESSLLNILTSAHTFKVVGDRLFLYGIDDKNPLGEFIRKPEGRK